MTCTTSVRTYKGLLLFVFFLCCAVTFSAPFVSSMDSSQSDSSAPVLNEKILINLREAFFQNIITLALPALNGLVANAVIPAQKTAVFSLEETQFTEFELQSANLTMEEPADVRIYTFNMSGVIPETNFSFKLGETDCRGIIEFDFNNTDAMIHLNISRMSNGNMVLEVGDINLEFGSMKADYSMEAEECRNIIQAAVSIIGDLGIVIAGQMKKEMPAQLRPVLEEKANEFLSSLPIVLLRDPSITADQVTLSLDIVTGPDTPYEPLDYPPAVEVLPDRDAGVLISEDSINKVIELLTVNGTLNRTLMLPAEYNSSLIEDIYPDAYQLCPGCPFSITFGTQLPPVVDLQAEETVIPHLCNVFLGLGLAPSNETDPIFIASLLLNLVGGLNQIEFTSDNRILFKASHLETLFMNLLEAIIGPIRMNALNDKALLLGNYGALPLFNAKFDGIELPSFVDDPVINVTPSAIVAGLNVVARRDQSRDNFLSVLDTFGFLKGVDESLRMISTF